MKGRFLIFIVILIICFQSCDILRDDKLDNYVENVYSNCKDKCVVNFNNIFDYDKLYLFDEGVSNEEVSETIGFKYNGDKDISRLILFVKNKTIVYEQNLVFNDSESYKVFFVTNKEYFENNVEFSLEKDENIFILKPIQK
ncbi:hypothetical protein [Flavobacterium sp. FlaQc-50]|jgi:hypothetical protein|uniref:hypothetical protein n=1 Tax=unclassified Flavobacterium TaxID=196869 RepID=UPI00375785C2